MFEGKGLLRVRLLVLVLVLVFVLVLVLVLLLLLLLLLLLPPKAHGPDLEKPRSAMVTTLARCRIVCIICCTCLGTTNEGERETC